jgi:predicted nucleic acid-binding protein
MILADSSVWIGYLRWGNPVLSDLLARQRVAMHPFIIGEVALGNLTDRGHVIGQLQAITQLRVVPDLGVLTMIEQRRLAGAGIGYVDAHLIAATLIADGVRLWTHDKALAAAADRLGVAAKLQH